MVRNIGGSYRAQLGESPVWSDEDGCLYFVDICKKEVCAVTPTAASDTTDDDTLSRVKTVVPLPNSPGCIVPSSKGGYLVAIAVHEDGTGGRLYRIDPSGAAAAAGDSSGGGGGGEGAQAGSYCSHSRNVQCIFAAALVSNS